MDSIANIRAQFPALSQKMNGRDLVYLDNAATSQKPHNVINLINKMNGGINANVHRAMYLLADEATSMYEAARTRVKEYINAPNREDIIFTSGTTASINLVADTFCRTFLNEGDVIIVSEDSHHSNIVPWQLACQRNKASLRVIPVKDNGEWDTESLFELIDYKVKLISVPHISNVLGVVNPIERLIEIGRAHV